MKVDLGQQQQRFAKASDLLGDDLEFLLREINDFCGGNAPRREDTPKVLEDYLMYVAKTGNPVFPWQQIRPLYRWKLQASIAMFSEEPMPMEATVLERFDLFRSAPFTIQRLSELITEPRRHYKSKEKFLFALEKAVYVVSTVEPMSLEEAEEQGNDGSGDIENRRPDTNPVRQNPRDSLMTTYIALSTPTTAETMGMTGDISTSFPQEVVSHHTEDPIDQEGPMDEAAEEVVVTVTEPSAEEEVKAEDSGSESSVDISEYDPTSSAFENPGIINAEALPSIVTFPVEVETTIPMTSQIPFDIGVEMVEQMDSISGDAELPSEVDASADAPVNTFETLTPESEKGGVSEMGGSGDVGLPVQNENIQVMGEETVPLVSDADAAAGEETTQAEEPAAYVEPVAPNVSDPLTAAANEQQN